MAQVAAVRGDPAGGCCSVVRERYGLRRAVSGSPSPREHLLAASALASIGRPSRRDNQRMGPWSALTGTTVDAMLGKLTHPPDIRFGVFRVGQELQVRCFPDFPAFFFVGRRRVKLFFVALFRFAFRCWFFVLCVFCCLVCFVFGLFRWFRLLCFGGLLFAFLAFCFPARARASHQHSAKSPR